MYNGWGRRLGAAQQLATRHTTAFEKQQMQRDTNCGRGT